MKKQVLTLLLLCLPNLALADYVPSFAKPVPSISYTRQETSNFVFKGYLDTSYNYLSRNNTFTSGVYDRVYDLTLNGFTVQQGSLTLAYQPEMGFGALVNPVAGRDAYQAAPYGWNPDFGSQWFGFFIPQAFLQYAGGSFNIIAGSFNTLAGNENLDPTTDTNFSRSILWGHAEPTTHLGIRTKYFVNSMLNLTAGLNNGWDDIEDTGRRKTIELSTTFTPHPVFSLEATLYSGGQRATDRISTGPQSIRTLLDLVAIFNLSNKLSLIANYDYGNQTKATLPTGNVGEAVFTGIAGYANYKFNDAWRTSLRGEIFSDRNGYRTGVRQCLKEVTLTVGYVVLKGLELRGETRRDFSNVNSFVTTERNGVSNNNQSFALEGLYQFG